MSCTRQRSKAPFTGWAVFSQKPDVKSPHLSHMCNHVLSTQGLWFTRSGPGGYVSRAEKAASLNLRVRHRTLGLAGTAEGPEGGEVNTAAALISTGTQAHAHTPGNESYARDTFPGLCVCADGYSFTL